MFSLQLPDCTRTGTRSSQGTLWLKYLLCCRFWWDSQQLNASALSWCIMANSLIVGLKQVTSRNRMYTACKESKLLQVKPKINFLSLSFLLRDLTQERLNLSFSQEIPLRKELWTTPFPSPLGHFSSTYLLPVFQMGKHTQDFDVEITDVATKWIADQKYIFPL